MTPARFDRPERTTPHAGITPGAQRETCIHRLGGDVRLPETSAALNPRWFGGTRVDAGGREAVGESLGQRGRTGM